MTSNIQKVRSYIKDRQIGTLISKTIGWFSHRIDRVLTVIFLHFPLRDNIILFRSISDFSDNARVFYDYLIEHGFNRDYKIVWMLEDTSPREYVAPHNVKFIRLRAWHPAFYKDYYIAVAKCIICTHGFGKRYSRKGQTLFHISHSASQLKAPKAAFGIKSRLNPDYGLACGPDGVEKKKKSLGLSEDRLPIIGMPRLDLLFQENDCIPKLLEEYHGEHFILSMETFKKSSYLVDSLDNNDMYAINVVHSQEDLRLLDAYLKELNSILIVKIHPLQDLSCLHLVDFENIRFLTNQDLNARGIQLYQLLKNTDVLLTDYSSIFYDFLLLDRPIGFLLGDMEQYDRGFIDADPLKEMVGEKIYTLDDLITFIKETRAGIDHYREDRKKLRDRVFTYQDGNNCKRLLEWMQENQIIS